MGCSCCKLSSRSDSTASLCPSDQSQVSCSSTKFEVEVSLRSEKVKDICGLKSSKFLILDGIHYTEVESLKDEISTFSDRKPLRDKCQHGDHYLAQYNEEAKVVAGNRCSRFLTRLSEEEFYVINGKSCTVVDSLSHCHRDNTVIKERIFNLHPDCQGGSHYLANRAGFYIIYEDNTYLHVQDMSEHGYQSSTANRNGLHETFTDGDYYFATNYYFYIMKDHNDLGLVHHRTKDLRSAADAEIVPVSASIASGVRRGHNGTDQPSQTHAGDQVAMQ